MIRIKQDVPVQYIKNIEDDLCKSLDNIKVQQMNLKGKSIGITAGSRGIRNIPLILKIVAYNIIAAGGNPVLIPSMGSHGGGSIVGQHEILTSLGITEDDVGIPIRYGVDTFFLGETPSKVPVYCQQGHPEKEQKQEMLLEALIIRIDDIPEVRYNGSGDGNDNK